MEQQKERFEKWFKKPLEKFYSDKDAGYMILMISLPLLERYLREKSGCHEEHFLKDPFFDLLISAFPILGDKKVARKFWEIYRHGLLHQATLKGTVNSAGVHNDCNEIEYSYGSCGDQFCVSPNKISKKIIQLIENDFRTFIGSGSPNHNLTTINPHTGHSGYEKS